MSSTFLCVVQKIDSKTEITLPKIKLYLDFYLIIHDWLS